jgi:hypothetical protein
MKNIREIIFLFFIFLIKLNLISAQGQAQGQGQDSTQLTEEKILNKLQKISHENDAIKILNECVYNNMKFSNLNILQLIYKKNWMKSINLILDFLVDISKPEFSNEVKNISTHITNSLQTLKSFLSGKKKNIVRISPIFEWSQDNNLIKIRIKFSKNLESPGEKDIQNFKVNLGRQHLEVQGYKVHEEYVAHYYRDIHLYEFARPYSVKAYKETDGTYIVRFEKATPTMYWNFLDQITGDHSNMHTWVDVFTTFDDKAKYTQFREWTQENLLLSDVEDHVKGKVEENRTRLIKINNIAQYLRTKDYENKNFCNSPPGQKYCMLTNIYDWNYWLS